MTEIIFLEVPFAEKDEAKALGARWNQEKKKWYVPAGVNAAIFDKWLPAPLLEAIAPIYLLQSVEQCYQCGKAIPVFALAATGIIEPEDESLAEFVVLSHITDLPQSFKDMLKQRCPGYFIDYSKTTQSRYLMNHCSCGAKLGDFHMHGAGGGAFVPSSLSKCTNISVTRIPGDNNVPVGCEYSYTPDNPIKGLKPKRW